MVEYSLHCAPNIFSTYILKTKIIQPNYPDQIIFKPLMKNTEKKKNTCSSLMVVGGQYDGMVTPQIHLSLSYKCFINLMCFLFIYLFSYFGNSEIVYFI